jgi:hypothetical protein
MDTLTLLLAMLAVCGSVFVLSTVVMGIYLERHGIKLNILLLRLLAFKIIKEYKNLTVKKMGRAGIWYYLSIISANSMLVCALAAFIVWKIA